MTRKHFELIAAQIRESRDSFKSNAAHAEFARRFAATLRLENPRFDAYRFVMAAMPREFEGTRHANVWERTARLA